MHILVLYRQKLQYVRSTIITWSLCTATVSVLDIVTLALLATDYNTVLNNYEVSNKSFSI